MTWQQLSRCLSLSATALGALCFIGWAFGVPVLTRLNPAWVTMKPNTAICLILTGLAAAVVSNQGCSKKNLRVAQTFAVLIFITGFLTLLEHLGGWDFGIDQALFVESVESAGRSFPGRMGPMSALIFMCFGASILSLDIRTRVGSWPAQTFAILAAALTFLVFLGYFYNVELPASLAKYFSIALHTAVAFMLLCAGLLFARPGRGMMATFLADDAGGAMARRLLPAAFLIPSLAGWLFAMGRENGHYGRGVAVALLAACVTVVFTWLIWSTAKATGRVDLRRRKAEENLIRSERQLADFFDNAAVALHWVGPDGTVLRVNDTELAMLGYSREEYVGKNIVDFHVSRPVIDNILKRLTDGEVLTDYPAQLKKKDGTVCDVLIHSSVYRENGAFIHTRCFTRDVTEHNRTAEALRTSMIEATQSRQKAEAASRAKDDFLAALSHELRTPLTPVLLAATDMAEDPSLPDEVRGQLAMISRNVSLEARLIDDLLDLTRIARGKLGLSLARVDAHELVRHAEEIVRADLSGRKLDLRFQLEAAVHLISADGARLQQVFWNILKNAVKFTPDGGVITVRSSNPSPDLLSITVSDTGRGIPQETLDRIFLPFDQGDLNGRHAFGGLGLGLSISRALINLHGGRLFVSSEGIGRGSVFSVELSTMEEAG